MIVAGVMSGTSADGINVALVRVGEGAARRGRSRGTELKIDFLGHSEFPYPPKVREAVLRLMNAKSVSVADLARMNFLLGGLYAEAILAAAKNLRHQPELIGCHGQTLYHQGEPQNYLGKKITATWQTGEAAVIAARVGIPVVSDFRPGDMAHGGKGAPLVPFLDYLLYRDARIGRVVQNIGGIANLTAIPAAAKPDDVIAFDTGPGNMVIDGLTERLFREPFDRDGHIAGAGSPVEEALADLLAEPFFRRKPPKTAGREEFGREFVREVARRCGRVKAEDMVATATALTARSITDALRRFVLRGHKGYREFVVSGGGTKNATLMAMLANGVGKLGLELRSTDEFGLPSEAKEATAFAVLAYRTWMRQPSNVRSATGAKRAAVLGKISYA